MRLARISSTVASHTIPDLVKKGYADQHGKIVKDGGYRLVPILPEFEDAVVSMGFDIVDGFTHSRDRTPPQERIRAALKDLPKNVIDDLPMRWEYVGDIAIIRLSESAEPYKKRIGEVYARELDMETICADCKGISGELRKPSMEVLYGTRTESIRLENGILYDFDVTKVMFASGNVDERGRMKNLDCTGETIIDMFAGIGYFTLPLAKFANPKKIIACEKNPESFEFLLKNIELNDVGDIIEPVLGDNRDLKFEGKADRILMGYVQTTSEFLPKALSMIKKGGMIHYHDTFYVNEYRERIEGIFSDNCDDFKIENIREVKSFAPSVSHYVADVRIL